MESLLDIFLSKPSVFKLKIGQRFIFEDDHLSFTVNKIVKHTYFRFSITSVEGDIYAVWQSDKIYFINDELIDLFRISDIMDIVEVPTIENTNIILLPEKVGKHTCFPWLTLADIYGEYDNKWFLFPPESERINIHSFLFLKEILMRNKSIAFTSKNGSEKIMSNIVLTRDVRYSHIKITRKVLSAEFVFDNCTLFFTSLSKGMCGLFVSGPAEEFWPVHKITF
jgi:hypothetical protein